MTASDIKRGAIVRLAGSRLAWRVLGVSEDRQGRLSFSIRCGKAHSRRQAHAGKPLSEIQWLTAVENLGYSKPKGERNG